MYYSVSNFQFILKVVLSKLLNYFLYILFEVFTPIIASFYQLVFYI